MYSNENIKKLIEERDKLDYEIKKEIEKEKAKYKFSYKRAVLMLFIIIFPFIMYKLNTKIFPPTSIWSWEYYIKK